MTLLTARFDLQPPPATQRAGPHVFGPWRLATQHAAAVEGIVSEAGLRLAGAAEAKTLTLTSEIAIPLEARAQGLQLSVALRSPDRALLRAGLVSVALLRLGKKERQIALLTFGAALFEDDAEDGLRLDAALSWPFPEGRHLVELRFRAGVGPVTIAKLVVDLAPRPPMLAPWPVPAPPRRPPPGAGPQLRVAVLSWDVSDNPFGRAHLLADMISRRHGVELLGSAFTRPEQGVWAPLQDSSLPVRFFPGGAMRDFLTAARTFAATVDCDVVYVSKPRLPGLLLALLLVHRLGCPVILDIDDHELAFFRPAAAAITPDAIGIEAATADPADLDRPQGSFWTRVGEGLVASFAQHTVANASLATRFGGLLVRHGRDEARFHPDPAQRAAVRHAQGLAETDRVILFAGTPRRHKGLDRLIAALAALGDPRLLLVVIGTVHDRRYQRELAAHRAVRIRFLPDTPFSRLPTLLQMADGVCLLQDLDSPIAQYQTPAKLSDALSLGIPVAMTPVPTIAELAPQRLITLIHDEAGLRDWLLGIAAGQDSAEDRRRRLDWSGAELSYAVNGARIERALTTALEQPVAWQPEWTQLLTELNRLFEAELPTAPPAWAQRPNLAAPVLRRRQPLDLVFFWKQNDTGIYGRRHDMLLKYLRQNEHVGTIVQFDAPIRIDHMHGDRATSADQPLHHGKLVADATARRFLEIDDAPGLVKRTFVYARERGTSFLGRSLPGRDDYQAFVAKTIAQHCRGTVIGWSWPIAPLHPEIAGSLGLDLQVVDLVDDQRTMARDARRAEEAEQAYAAALAGADLAFANCGSVAEAFAPLSPAPIHVIPNACEFYGAAGGRPAELEGVEGPVVGYVGNLRSRIDIDLLEGLLTQRPGWTFVLIGSAHNSTDILRLRRHPNLRLLGPRVYEEALSHMRCFDVAIMPHCRNAISERMNPLKLYVYVALGIPVVSTDVANIDELRDRIAVADDAADFLAKLDAAVARRGFAGPNRPPPAESLWPISWPKRVADMVGLCRKALLV